MAITDSNQHEERGAGPEEARARELEGFARLDRLVRSLVSRFQQLAADNEALRRRLEEREERVRALDGKLLELNQTRRDAAKRLDDLLAQIDQLDARLGGAGASDASPPGSD